VVNNENGKQTQLMVFPGIVIEYENKAIGALLLKGNKLSNSQEILNQSIEGLEYEIIQAIQLSQKKERKKIGFLLDYSKVPAAKQMDLIRSMKKKYDLFPVDLGRSMTLDGLDAICLIQPSKTIESKDLFKIDQFLVNGGKAVFLMDGCKVDTIQNQGIVFTPSESGLEELFFRSGVRLNNNIIKDAQLCGAIPLIVGNFGDKPNMQLMPWPAFPLFEGNHANPISRNLDAVYSKFASSIDTFPAVNLVKTVLLNSGSYTQIQKSPATLPFAASGKEFDPQNFTAGPKIAALLNHGYFHSIYTNRPIPNDSLKTYFKEKSTKKGAFILIGDSEIALNELDPKSHQPLPLGYDIFSQHTFANKDFIMNAFSYLLDEQQSLLARNKDVKLRPLDKGKIKEERSFWQSINLSFPILFAISIGFLVIFYRKQKYQG
jgi:gliding-associated putative ABC transporter substrate-binding component GldG